MFFLKFVDFQAIFIILDTTENKVIYHILPKMQIRSRRTWTMCCIHIQLVSLLLYASISSSL